MVVNILSKVMGLLLILVGLGIALTVLAFSTMIADPSLSDAAWWAEYWKKMETGGGWGGLGMGMFMVAVGGWLLLVPPGPEAEEQGKSLKAARNRDI